MKGLLNLGSPQEVFGFFFALLHFFRGFDFLSREEYFFIQQINFSQAKNEAFRKGN